MQAAPQGALGVILSELQRTSGLRPMVEERDGWVMFLNTDGHGQGVQLLGDSDLDQLVRFAERVQEWAVEELWNSGRAATWPECPFHRNSHPLEPAVVSGAASWLCPTTLEAVARIGELST